VFTDKLVAKIPSTASGVVRSIHFDNDTICAVGHAIMTVEEDDGAESSEPVAKVPVPDSPKKESSCPLE
jgi:pyruvate/2-oxoglutarate dehydrogenase complex dihydrolipoamide acyltransferase (E2) component